MLAFKIHRAGSRTGSRLRDLIEERGVETRIYRPEILEHADGIVCYGAGLESTDLACLNRRAGEKNKLEQLLAFSDVGVSIPPLGIHAPVSYPAYGRSNSHRGGRDIILVFEPCQVGLAQAGGTEFFTSYVPHQREFRLFVYRRRLLGTYQKLLIHPEQYRGITASRRNGFGFIFQDRSGVPEVVIDESIQAVDVLGLDFGAVDVLWDGERAFVLEVNTAPGVEEDRQGIVRLADKICRWVELDYPERRGEGE